MLTVKNTSIGPRGFHDKNSGFVLLDKGGVATEVEMTKAERASADATGYFEITGDDTPKAKDKKITVTAPKTADDEAPDYAAMTDDDLRAALKDKLGDLAPADADRPTMLSLLTE
jgi:hypothetical protein